MAATGPPATSASHYLAEDFHLTGGFVHQAEDEIAAICAAVGAAFAGSLAITSTSGPGMALKGEALGLATMVELPLVVVNVQRGGPSTGQPTKAEQGDLLTSVFGSHGDAPKVVMAVADIEDCFYSVITARRIAETDDDNQVRGVPLLVYSVGFALLHLLLTLPPNSGGALLSARIVLVMVWLILFALLLVGT